MKKIERIADDMELNPEQVKRIDGAYGTDGANGLTKLIGPMGRGGAGA